MRKYYTLAVMLRKMTDDPTLEWCSARWRRRERGYVRDNSTWRIHLYMDDDSVPHFIDDRGEEYSLSADEIVGKWFIYEETEA